MRNDEVLEVGDSERLVNRLLDNGLYKKLAEFIMMRDHREERYALEMLGSLREILGQRLRQQRDEELNEILKMVKYAQVSLDPDNYQRFE